MPGKFPVEAGGKVSVKLGGRMRMLANSFGAVIPFNPGTMLANPQNFSLPDNTPNNTLVTTLSVTGQDQGVTLSNWRRTSGFSKVTVTATSATTATVVINDANGLDATDQGAKTMAFAVDYTGLEAGTLSITVTGNIYQTATPPPTGFWTSSALTNPSLTQVNMITVAQGSQGSMAGGTNTCLDGRNKTYYCGQTPHRSPIKITDWRSGVMTGARLVCDTERTRLWRDMKPDWDSDGCRPECNGDVIVEGVWADNCMDSINPVPGGTDGFNNTHLIVRHCYIRYNRDDVIENDSCMDITVEDCLVDGCFMFYSERPGSQPPANTTCASPQKPAVFRRNLVRFERMPYQLGKPLQHQQIFKLGNNTGPVECYDSIFVIPSPPVGATDDPTGTFNFPPGTYSNNIICWTGRASFGNFPGSPPSGWTIVETTTAFDNARTQWLADHGGDSTGDDFPWLHK